LFVAVELPWTVRERLALMAGGVPGARWLDAEQMHLTLRFIGEVDIHTQSDIEAALSKVRVEPFSLRIDGMGCFGNGRTARALWAGLAANETLTRLQGKVETAISKTGLAPERRKFHPHITLARLKHPDMKRLRDFLSRNGDLVSEDLPVDHFTLFSSHRGNAGAVYREEAAFPLTA
jgi:2'-5' RNA ligase